MTMYREPGTSVDVTDVERARIHEAAETRREHIRQREETRRERTKALGIYPYVILGITMAIMTIVGGIVVSQHIGASHPEADKPCADSVHVLDEYKKEYQCVAGARLETEKADGKTLARCRCPVSSATLSESRP